ncbi:MAG: electron transfer flavoprotein subunit beta, partial [Christensenella sp.]
KEVAVWTLEDLDVDRANIGLKGSPTHVFKSFTKPLKSAGVMVNTDVSDSVDFLMEKLRSKFIL